MNRRKKKLLLVIWVLGALVLSSSLQVPQLISIYCQLMTPHDHIRAHQLIADQFLLARPDAATRTTWLLNIPAAC